MLGDKGFFPELLGDKEIWSETRDLRKFGGFWAQEMLNSLIKIVFYVQKSCFFSPAAQFSNKKSPAALTYNTIISD